MTPEEVSNQVRELESLRAQLRLWRTLVPLITVSIIALGVYTIYRAGDNLVADGPPREEFVAAFTDGLNREVRPTVEKVAQQIGEGEKSQIELLTQLKQAVEMLAANQAKIMQAATMAPPMPVPADVPPTPAPPMPPAPMPPPGAPV